MLSQLPGGHREGLEAGNSKAGFALQDVLEADRCPRPRPVMCPGIFLAAVASPSSKLQEGWRGTRGPSRQAASGQPHPWRYPPQQIPCWAVAMGAIRPRLAQTQNSWHGRKPDHQALGPTQN